MVGQQLLTVRMEFLLQPDDHDYGDDNDDGDDDHEDYYYYDDDDDD